MTALTFHVSHPAAVQGLTPADVREMYTDTTDPEEVWQFLAWGDSHSIGTYHMAAPYVFVTDLYANTLTLHLVPQRYVETYGSLGQASRYIWDLIRGHAALD